MRRGSMDARNRISKTRRWKGMNIVKAGGFFLGYALSWYVLWRACCGHHEHVCSCRESQSKPSTASSGIEPDCPRAVACMHAAVQAAVQTANNPHIRSCSWFSGALHRGGRQFTPRTR
eukprot:Amastigsp_a510256_65.p2 type:complete len:118 gc:universal Amastigsp_a510256_65:243-596(+)